jgi:hypothetical protein
MTLRALQEAEAAWQRLVPEGARAWQCADCGAACALDARRDCVRTRDVRSGCGFVRDRPEFLELAWPFYVHDVVRK